MTPNPKGFPKDSLRRLRDAVPTEVPDHWSFRTDVDRANRAKNRRASEFSDELARLMAELELVKGRTDGGVGK